MLNNRNQSPIFNDVCKYLIRYRRCIGNELGLNTVCCWRALRNNECVDTTENDFFHYFCCESLGFSMDISSNNLRECGDHNSYGAIFQSSFIRHGTSFPICVFVADKTVSCSQSKSTWIPFAWGRGGGSKKEKEKQTET